MTTKPPHEGASVSEYVRGHDEFYAALGRASAMWGQVEQQFNYTLVGVIMHMRENKYDFKVQDILWRSFNKRVELWRKMFELTPSLAGCRDDAVALVSDLKRLADDRARVVHCAYGGFRPDGSRDVSYWYGQDKKLMQARGYVRIEDLNKFTFDIAEMYHRILKITLPVSLLFIDNLDANESGDAGGEGNS